MYFVRTDKGFTYCEAVTEGFLCLNPDVIRLNWKENVMILSRRAKGLFLRRILGSESSNSQEEPNFFSSSFHKDPSQVLQARYNVVYTVRLEIIVKLVLT